MNLPTNTATMKTMSSSQLGELLGYDKSTTNRKIKDMFEAEIVGGIITSTNRENNQVSEYYLPEVESQMFAAKWNIQHLRKVVEFFVSVPDPAVVLPGNYIEALQALIESEKEKSAAQEQLQLAAPKVAFVDELVNRDNLMTATQVGQKHKMSAIKLNRFLDELGGVYSKRVERGRVFLQPFINKGYGELKQNNTGHDQPLFTNKGEIWINEQLAAKGVE